jgi:VWFA-related protein
MSDRKHFFCFRTTLLVLGIAARLSALSAHGAPVPQSMTPQSLLPLESDRGEQSALVSADLFSDTSEDTQYTDGTRAIQAGRWADAESIFDRVIQSHGEHIEGALYWKAYAENKQDKSDAALKTCAALRQGFPKSRWVDDCGALEIDIRGRSGQPVDPQSQQDENLRLLALSTLMHHNESKALPQIQQILSGNQPEPFKEQALFVLAQSESRQATKMLANVANPPANAPESIRSNAALRQRAEQLISAGRGSIAGSADGNASARVRRPIGLDVVVTDKDGKPVSGLDADNFTVLDNGQPQKILGFHSSPEPGAGSAGKIEPPTEVLILIDTVNSSLTDVAYERQQVEIYLRQNGGKLANPVTIFFFNGDGTNQLTASSRDGNALADALDKQAPNLRPIRRAQGFYGAEEKIQRSLETLSTLAVEESRRPGRKMLLWISPGWPLLARSDAYTSEREDRTLFAEIVAMSTALREARVTLYAIDPERGADSLEWYRYEEFRKPVTKSANADLDRLALQVITEQSGGRAVGFSKEYLSGTIATVLKDADTYYYFSFDPPPSSHEDEYHSLKITVSKPGLTAHTRSGYYNEP